MLLQYTTTRSLLSVPSYHTACSKELGSINRSKINLKLLMIGNDQLLVLSDGVGGLQKGRVLAAR